MSDAASADGEGSGASAIDDAVRCGTAPETTSDLMDTGRTPTGRPGRTSMPSDAATSGTG